jgi:hypothetical protein
MGQRDSLTLAQLALAEIGWTLGEAAVAQKLIDQARERERDLPINVKSRLAAVRMQFALSQRRGPEARLAGQDMMTAAATVRGVSLCIAAAHSAEAEALSGNRTRAGALRAQSLECASRQNMADLMVEVWLAASETSAMLGEDAAARGFAQQAYAAATRFVRREDAWHAALLLGPAYTDSATTTAAAGELRSAWGDAAWNTYCSRPDRSARTKALERRTQ